MRVPARNRVSGSATSRIHSLPAPFGGLNARDSVANMKSEDATILENWFPRPTDVVVRNGYTSFATFTGTCKTVVIYNGSTATKVFVAVDTTNDALIDATSGGAISTPVVGGITPTVQAITNTVMDYVQIGTTGGQFLSIVNGTDTAIEYDGTTWSTATLTHASLSGTDKLFTNGVFSSRLWLAEKDTFNLYYTATGAKSGATTQLNVGPLFKLGGALNSIVTVTDATQALADYIGFLSTQGELIAFGGDPAGATWTKVAHFVVPRPIVRGNRAWVKYGADALILSADGVMSLRNAITEDRFDAGAKFSEKIRNAINTEVAANGGKSGWCVTYHPSGTKLVVNVPTSSYVASRQYAMNTQTGSWAKFTGWNFFHFAVTSDTLYAGGSGLLVKADTGGADGSDAIRTDAKQASSYFGTRGLIKAVKMVRPMLSLNGPAGIAVSVNADFSDQPATSYQTIDGGAGDPWGTGTWSAAWVAGTTINRYWRSAPGVGSAIALRLQTQTEDTSLSWASTDIAIEHGGAI